MTHQTAPDNHGEATDRLRRLAEMLFAPARSDTRAGLGHLVREIEAAQPGFIALLNAANDARRLGLNADATQH